MTGKPLPALAVDGTNATILRFDEFPRFSIELRRAWCTKHQAFHDAKWLVVVTDDTGAFMAIAQTDSAERAKKIVTAVFPIGDWTRPVRTILADEELHVAVGIVVRLIAQGFGVMTFGTMTRPKEGG